MIVEPLLKALERRDVVSEEERQVLKSLPMRLRQYRTREELVAEGSRPTESCLILDGFAGRAQFLSDGRRQIAAVHLMGDFVDLHGMLLRVMDHSVVALSPCTAAFVPHEALRPLISSHPHLGRLLWLSTVIDGAIQRTWITCIGRRAADSHIAHLLCELYLRLKAVDMVDGDSFAFPVTQSEVADMVGLSIVHVNRTIQELRGTGLIVWQGPRITILDHERLKKLADFDPTYLNFTKEPR